MADTFGVHAAVFWLFKYDTAYGQADSASEGKRINGCAVSKSLRDNMYNVDMQKCMRRIERKTIVGIYQKNIFHLIMDLVYQTAEIDEERS